LSVEQDGAFGPLLHGKIGNENGGERPRLDWSLRMATKFWLVCSVGTFCAALAVAALAESYDDDGNMNDGKWNARIDGDAKTARRASVDIEDFEGQWREMGARRAGDPCRGTKPFPITVQRSTAKEVEFSVWPAESSKCPDFSLTLDVVDERTLVGKTSDGREVRLTREPVKHKTPR
jgi:hypothetical protein